MSGLESFSAFLEASPLLDLSLFLTSKNYTGATRPLCSTVFPWPLQFIAPLRLRDRAEARCQHLGFSDLDVDSDKDPRPADPGAEPIWDLPSTLLDRPRAKVSSVLEKANRIRQNAWSESFFDPLQELLGEKRYLLSEQQPSSLDCLAMGYLTLALLPELPQPWLAGKMRLSFERLCGYADNLRGLFYNVPPDDYNEPKMNTDSVAADNPFAEQHQPQVREALPWVVSSVLLNNALESLPFVKQLRSTARLRNSFLQEAVEDSSTTLN